MSVHYVMDSDPDDTGAMLMRRIAGLEHVSFDDGALIRATVPPLELHMNEESQVDILDCVWSTQPGSILSDRFKRLLGYGSLT